MIPKSSQRFHFSGGAQFVHGGAMLQEICVPIITVRELQKEQVAKYTEATDVDFEKMAGQGGVKFYEFKVDENGDMKTITHIALHSHFFGADRVHVIFVNEIQNIF